MLIIQRWKILRKLKELFSLDNKLKHQLTDDEIHNKSIRIQQHKIAVIWEALRDSYLAGYEKNTLPVEDYIFLHMPQYARGITLDSGAFKQKYVLSHYGLNYYKLNITDEIEDKVKTAIGYYETCQKLKLNFVIASKNGYYRTLVLLLNSKSILPKSITDYINVLAKIYYCNVILQYKE